ncbi:NAD(P)/FAD-dependent oxidoreductase [Labrys monachus]|uniref:Glycine/D-amino acid oxidase-like deaminating enzyme n=1 Tax=Labrys monachus TaxID=217067 RepID=A0ABU0F7C9_9HYPH|nr:FAD-binding oxidoreductase [Labrys monachus]MDQ0390517.1 glycine/D-amino acid oxidase-like deaminating enzyme [Labrys monachus]
MASPHPVVGEIEVLVIGGGVVGSCLAGFLAEDGVGVALIDDGRIGGSNANAGSLHVQMQSRFMRLYPQNVPGMERQLPLYPKGVAAWQALEKKLDAHFDLKMTGGLMVAESLDQLEFLRVKAARERELGLEVEVLGRAELDRIAPYFGESVVGAELCADEGKLNPLLCNAAIRRWILARGVVLIEGEAAGPIRREGAGFVVETKRGPIRAGRVVLAAASGSKALAAGLGVAIPAEPEPLHMNITEPTSAMIGHLVQHADRMITLKQFGTGQIVIGGGWPAHLAGERRHPTVELASLIANATLAQHIVPRIAPLRIIRTWAGINTAVDGKGVLGPVGPVPGLFAAIPGDAGYTLGPLSARLVAEMMAGRAPGEDMAPFSPDRFG